MTVILKYLQATLITIHLQVKPLLVRLRGRFVPLLISPDKATDSQVSTRDCERGFP